MNKEMVEIMELKGELKELKTTTEEELTRLSKKIKDNKNDNTKLIESKFEEIMDTVNFTVNNNPNIAKAKGENSNVSANSDADVERIINDRIASYEKGRDEDIGELTSVVEEIADRLVEENKGIKNRIKELENSTTVFTNLLFKLFIYSFIFLSILLK